MKHLRTFTLTSLLALFLGASLVGCGPKDTTTEQAPPPGPNAQPEQADPGKMQRLPGAVQPTGG